MKVASMKLADRCQKIQLVVSDVDGVLTDGGIVFDNQGIESKRFHVRDGQGIKLWQRSGGKFALVTARSSHIVKLRAAELGIELVRQGSEDKLRALKEIAEELKLTQQQVCYVGDDLPDLPAIRYAGLGVAVADACPEVLEAADLVTTTPGGGGAVRELMETILKAQRRWSDLMQSFGESAE